MIEDCVFLLRERTASFAVCEEKRSDYPIIDKKQSIEPCVYVQDVGIIQACVVRTLIRNKSDAT